MAGALAVSMSTDGVHVSVQTSHYDAYIAWWVDMKAFVLKRALLTIGNKENLPLDAPVAINDEGRAPALASRFVNICKTYGINNKLSGITTDGPSVMSE